MSGRGLTERTRLTVTAPRAGPPQGTAAFVKYRTPDAFYNTERRTVRPRPVCGGEDGRSALVVCGGLGAAAGCRHWNGSDGHAAVGGPCGPSG